MHGVRVRRSSLSHAQSQACLSYRNPFRAHSEEEDPADGSKKSWRILKREGPGQLTRPRPLGGRARRGGAVPLFIQPMRDCLYFVSKPRGGTAVVELEPFRKV